MAKAKNKKDNSKAKATPTKANRTAKPKPKKRTTKAKAKNLKSEGIVKATTKGAGMSLIDSEFALETLGLHIFERSTSNEDDSGDDEDEFGVREDHKALIDALLTLAARQSKKTPGYDSNLPAIFVRLHSKGIVFRRFFSTSVGPVRMCDTDTTTVGAIWSPSLRTGITVVMLEGYTVFCQFGFTYNGTAPLFTADDLQPMQEDIIQNGFLGAPEEYTNFAPELFHKQFFVDYYKKCAGGDLSASAYEERSLDSVDM